MKKSIIYPLMAMSIVLLAGCNKGSNSTSNNGSNSTIDDKKTFVVAYYSEDNKLLYEEEVKKGESSLYKGEEPTKNSDVLNFEYSFFAWDKDLTNVQEDLEVHPIFKKLSAEELEVGDYTYRRFINENNETEAYEIYKYNNFDDEISVTLPQTYLDKPIIQIGKACFMETPVTSLVVPEGIEVIDAYAFNSCDLLSSVTLPSSLRIINHAAFYLTSTLKSIDLKNTQFIGEDNFELCGSLKSLNIGDSNTFYSTYENGLYLNDYSTLIKMAENVSDVKIHENCNTLAIESLSRLNNVKNVTIDSNITNMEEGVFFESQVTNVTINALIEEIPYNCFKFCRNLVSVSLPSSLNVIGEYGFYRCEKLSKINLPDSISEIKDFAFAYCYALESFYVPTNLSYFGYGALDEMTSLKEFVVSERNSYFKAIDGSLFSYDLSTIVRVPETKTSIMLPSVTKTIGSGAFYKCQKIKQLQLPSGLQTIEKYAFYFMNEITKLDIPNTVTTIEESAFDTMEKLVTIKLPNSMKSLSDNLFAYCTALENVTLPSDLEVIGRKTFYSCESLLDITLPGSVKEIGYHAFELCSNLETIHFDGSVEDFNKINTRESGIPSSVTIICKE